MGNDVEKYARKEIELIGRRRQALERVALAQQVAGTALVDEEQSESSSAASEGLGRALVEVAQMDAALVVCRSRRLAAVQQKRADDAARLRTQIRELRDQLDPLERKTQKCMETLSALQGMAYTAAPTPTEVGTPLSARLQTEITSLERRIAGLESELPHSGTLDIGGCSADELVAAVLGTEASIPPVQDILDWIAAVERSPKMAGRRFTGDLRFHFAWKDGRIDIAQSYIQAYSLGSVTPGPTWGTPVFTIGSDIFRAQEA